MNCPDCQYLQAERAAIHEFDGRAGRTDAERMAADERCHAHVGEPAKRRYPRDQAIAVARELCDNLKPVVVEMVVAGSLRRRKDSVGDVEILFIPKFETRADPADMFGRELEVDLAAEQIEALLAAGILSKRPKCDGTFTWGAENKLAMHVASGIPVDLFSAQRANWANLVVCRTGSKESNERICNAAIARGWKWQPYGAGFQDRQTGKLIRTTRSERDVFAAVGLPYLEPWER